jgi:DNA-binding NarL/FixJ family response regulator
LEAGMKILLLEGNPDDAALAKEAILEIEESRRWRRWVRHIDLVHLERLEDATAVLAQEPFDVVLAGDALPDACGLAPLLSLRAQAPEAAVILLISGGDDALAVSAIREGAEDCIPKEELDCAPLARALRNAVERRRRAAALRSVILLDADTGLYNRNGFMVAAGRDRKLARRLSHSAWLVVAALGGADHAMDAAPPAPVELAEILRLSFPDTDVIARLEACRFAVLSLRGEGEDVSAPVAALRRRVWLRNRRRRGEPPLSVHVGTASQGASGDLSIEELLDLAQSSLCENRPSEPLTLDGARRASA